MSEKNLNGGTRNQANEKTQSGNQLHDIEYEYCPNDFDFSRIEWPIDGVSFRKSQFDRALLEQWDSARENGCFWYSLDEVRRRQLYGKFGLIAQLNTKRFSSRRKPSEIHTVQEPFVKERFNFTKIKEHEVLLKIVSKADSERIVERDNDNLMIINVSPIDYGHVLFVPAVTNCLPQRLNYNALKMAIEICLLSIHRGLRIGFNSLCAFASVNHLHFHVLYVNYQLPIDKVDISPIGHGLYELQNYFVRGFALQLENHDIHQLARRADEVTSLLYENDIPHNLVICRQDTSRANESSQESLVRVYIFPKLPAPAISDNPFNPAFLELAGYLPIGGKEVPLFIFFLLSMLAYILLYEKRERENYDTNIFRLFAFWYLALAGI